MDKSRIWDILLKAEREYIKKGETDTSFDIILDGLIEFSESEFGYIAEVKSAESERTVTNPEGLYLYVHSISDISWDETSKEMYSSHRGKGFTFDNECSIFGKGLMNKEIIIANDFLNYIDRKPTYPKGHTKIKSFLAVPLFFKDEMIGQIGLANKKDLYTDEIVSDIEPLVNRATNIIMFKRFMEEHKKLQHFKTNRRAKNVILANVSHEVRTPLNTILGMNALMLDTDIDDNQYECLLIERQSCYHLLGLITEILDINKLEAGKMQLKNGIIDIREMIEDCYDLIGIEAKKKGLDLYPVIDPKVPFKVIGDKQRVKQMIGNLLSNSVKFTDEGSITTQVTLVSAEEIKGLGLQPITLYNSEIHKKLTKKEAGDTPLYDEELVGEWMYLKFAVEDTGTGIKKEDLSKLFQSYSQLDDSTTKRHKGTGLGLAITQELCNLMNGSIQVESKYKEGSKFYFVIPLRVYKDHTQKLDLSVLEGKTLLLVDDKEENLMRLTNVLDKWGVNYRECRTAKRALISYVNNPRFHFDLGLIDIVMPNMDGNTLANRIARSNDPFPLIALSSQDDGDTDVSNAFIHRLVKPYTDEALLEVVVRVLSMNEDSSSSSYTDSEEDEFKPNEKYSNVINGSPKKKTSLDKGLRNSNEGADKKSKKLQRRKRELQIDNFYEKAQNIDINILIVEDQDYNLIMLKKMLENIGYHNIDTAKSGEEAVAMVELNKGIPRKKNEKSIYDLILMDIIMPGKYDGVEATKKINKMFRNLKLRPKVIATTASVLDGACERYKKEGKMDGCIYKPIDKIRKVTDVLRPLGFC
jgi:signal transduction histidine kinase/response regulator RpfG family c-di-GMP phosphodiesterase